MEVQGASVDVIQHCMSEGQGKSARKKAVMISCDDSRHS